MNSLYSTTEFLDLLSEYLTAGGSFQAAFMEAVNDLSSGKIKKVLSKNRSEIYTGDDLVKRVKATPNIFPESFPVLLEKVLNDNESGERIKDLSAYYKIVYDTWKSVKNAFLIFTCLLSVSLLFLFAARYSISLADCMYSEMDVDLPMPTNLLIMFSRFIQINDVWYVIAALLALLYYLIIFQKELISSFILKIPIISNLMLRIFSHAVCRNTVLLLAIKVPIEEIPQILKTAYMIPSLKESFTDAEYKIKTGMQSLSARKSKILFPVSIMKLMIDKEEEKLLRELQEFITFERGNLELIHKKFNDMFIPVTGFILFSFVLAVIIATYLPLTQIMFSLG